VSTGGPPSRTRQVSPDGKWVWDGKRWLPFKGPAGPPRISPDGKWVWDGKQWLPVARREAVFPAWSVAAQQPAPAPVAAQPELAPIPVIGPEGEEVEEEPAFNPYTYAAPAAPAWERPQTGFNKYLYIAAGVVVLLIAAVVLNSLGPFQFPWMASDVVAPRPSPTPSLAARTDSSQADRLLSGYLSPAFGTLGQKVAIQNEVCTGLLAFSCRDALRDTDQQLKNVIAIVGRQTAPACIAAPMTKMKGDLAAMDAGLKLALKAYADNSTSELTQGLANYHNADLAVTADGAAAAGLQKAVCSTAVFGP
jgi:hypothetical protein